MAPASHWGSPPSTVHPQTQVKGDAAEDRRGLACVFQKLLVGMEEEDWFIGNEVPKNQGKLNLLYPVSRAAITNWDDMEKVGSGCCWVGCAQGPPPMPGVACCPAPQKGHTDNIQGFPGISRLWVSGDATSQYSPYRS